MMNLKNNLENIEKESTAMSETSFYLLTESKSKLKNRPTMHKSCPKCGHEWEGHKNSSCVICRDAKRQETLKNNPSKIGHYEMRCPSCETFFIGDRNSACPNCNEKNVVKIKWVSPNDYLKRCKNSSNSELSFDKDSYIGIKILVDKEQPSKCSLNCPGYVGNGEECWYTNEEIFDRNRSKSCLGAEIK